MRIKLPPERVADNREADIRKLAHQKWQEAGSPHGYSLSFWLDAEREYEAEQRRFARRLALPALPDYFG